MKNRVIATVAFRYLVDSMLSLKCLVLLLIAEVSAETCRSYGIIYTYCESPTYCCNDNTQCCNSLTAGGIVGIVIGIVSSITVCVVICVCCYRRRNAAPGQVLQPNTGTQMVISSVNQQNTTVAGPQYPGQYPGQYPYPAYPQGQQPPAQYPGQQQPPAQYPGQQQPAQYQYPPPAYNYGQPNPGQDVPPGKMP